MKNKVTLIIPDIHLRHEQAERIIASVKADEIVFLGDYFDDFGDTPEMVSKTCDWLEASVNKPNRIHLFGNHDMHYAHTYRGFQCSGYDQWKYFLIHDTLPREVWDKFKYFHVLDNKWLLTHAGLHDLNLPDSVKKLAGDRPKFFKEIGEYLDTEVINGFRAVANNVPHWIFGAGRSRGGSQRVGGIVWCDFEREFIPIKGLNQIFGHTPQGLGFAKWCQYDNGFRALYAPYEKLTPTVEDLDNAEKSINIDLDVFKNTHYAIWDGKKLTVQDYNSL